MARKNKLKLIYAENVTCPLQYVRNKLNGYIHVEISQFSIKIYIFESVQDEARFCNVNMWEVHRGAQKRNRFTFRQKQQVL